MVMMVKDGRLTTWAGGGEALKEEGRLSTGMGKKKFTTADRQVDERTFVCIVEEKKDVRICREKSLSSTGDQLHCEKQSCKIRTRNVTLHQRFKTGEQLVEVMSIV